MKNYFRLIRYIRPYKSRAITSVVFNLLTVVFSLFSLTMIVPFLNVLFSQERNYVLKPWSGSVKVLLNNFNYYLSDFVVQHGQLEALSFISLLVVILFFLRSTFFVWLFLSNMNLNHFFYLSLSSSIYFFILCICWIMLGSFEIS